ncbi:hypothetical protein BJX61DRAFT_105128 [Aspergillus egyptiacus]|nr:hypothetical protein BJX61DRAFT_105128 [Aspergillus egyptiacus]
MLDEGGICRKKGTERVQIQEWLVGRIQQWRRKKGTRRVEQHDTLREQAGCLPKRKSFSAERPLSCQPISSHICLRGPPRLQSWSLKARTPSWKSPRLSPLGSAVALVRRPLLLSLHYRPLSEASFSSSPSPLPLLVLSQFISSTYCRIPEPQSSCFPAPSTTCGFSSNYISFHFSLPQKQPVQASALVLDLLVPHFLLYTSWTFVPASAPPPDLRRGWDAFLETSHAIALYRPRQLLIT